VTPASFDYDVALARLARLIVILGLLGTGIAGRFAGLGGAGGFLIGTTAAYLNFRLLERVVNRLGGDRKGGKSTGVRLFIQFGLFVLGAFAIIVVSGFKPSLGAALAGFFVCPVAAVLEILYELLTYGHS
jgi:hypothetical protein